MGVRADLDLDGVKPLTKPLAATELRRWIEANQAVRVARWRLGRQRLTAVRRELAAVVPIG
jgi:hypothetical protein